MAFDTGALSGEAFMTVDGLALPVVSGTGYGLQKTEKASVMGMDGYHGHSRKPIPGFIKAVVRNVAGLSVEEFDAMDDVAVSLELTNGKRASGNGMVCVGAVEVNSDEQTIELRFEGPDVRET